MIQKIVVAGFICADGKVLLTKRAATKALAPGKYHLPGGHVEHGEEVQQALAREILEELGVTIAVGDPYFVFSYVTAAGVHTVGITCLARLTEPKANLRFDENDTAECAWVAEDDLLHYLAAEDYNYRAAIAGFARWREGGEKRV
jgi:mutator protein MutT